jgi:hypothetical protein
VRKTSNPRKLSEERSIHVFNRSHDVSFFFLVSWGGVRLSLLGTSATNWPIVPAPDVDNDDECGAVGGMRIDRGNRSTRRKPTPVPLFLPQIPHDQTWARTRAVAVGSRRLTTWVTTRPAHNVARDHLWNFSLAKAKTCLYSVLLNRNIKAVVIYLPIVVVFYGFYAERICLLIHRDTNPCVTSRALETTPCWHSYYLISSELSCRCFALLHDTTQLGYMPPFTFVLTRFFSAHEFHQHSLCEG